MNAHLNEELLNSYSHYTLTDAQREAMDQHLASCPECRARLDTHQSHQQHIHYELDAELKAIHPPTTMAFRAIAPQLKPPSRLSKGWQRAGHYLPLAAALSGLTIAVVGLISSARPPTTLLKAQVSPLPPAVACLLMAVPVMTMINDRKRHYVQPRYILSCILAFILWLGTAVVGLYTMVVIREFIIRIYAYVWSGAARHGQAYWQALAIGNWAIYALSLVWIALVVGGGEYHYKHMGQRKSWKLFGWTIAVEACILILPLFI